MLTAICLINKFNKTVLGYTAFNKLGLSLFRNMCISMCIQFIWWSLTLSHSQVLQFHVSIEIHHHHLVTRLRLLRCTVQPDMHCPSSTIQCPQPTTTLLHFLPPRRHPSLPAIYCLHLCVSVDVPGIVQRTMTDMKRRRQRSIDAMTLEVAVMLSFSLMSDSKDNFKSPLAGLIHDHSEGIF